VYLSEYIKKLEEFKLANGDVEIDTEYWCEDCKDTHEGIGIGLELSSSGKLRTFVIPLGEG
jgi:hypothetical protein